MGNYEGAPYAVLVSYSGRSRKAHLLAEEELRPERAPLIDWTLCGQPAPAFTDRRDEPVCITCTRIADRLSAE